MRIAVTGKGGVGKTTVAGTLARLLGQDGEKVLAVDADPNYNLWSAIGIDGEIASQLVPLLNDETLVYDRTERKVVEVLGRFFELNPRVDDIAEKFAVNGPDNVRLLVAGTVTMGNSGCMCPSAALLKALIQHLVLQENESLVMDMDAGIENLGRGTAKGMDVMLIVVEPGRRALETLARISRLASDIGTDTVYAVGNKVSDASDREIIKKHAGKSGTEVLAYIPLDPLMKKADLDGKAPLDMSEDSPAILELKLLKEKLIQVV